MLWLHKVPRSKESQLVDAARANGIGVYPLSPLFHGPKHRSKMAGLVLGYASTPITDIERGIRRLARVVGTL